LIKPTVGKGLAHIDWSQQEFGIAAALSQDELMMKAYQSGDSYMAFAVQAKAVPPDATKESHRVERGRFKICSLGVLYGMGSKTMALDASCSEFEAKRLIELHKQTYKRFWQWSKGVVDYAEIHRNLWTAFGWEIKYPNDFSKTSAMNFPMQGNGADILRIACCLGTERGVKICAPIHDAILIEFDLENEEPDIATMQEAMREASSIVLNGFELRTEVKIVRYPDRYMDERGQEMWDTVWGIIDKLPKG
jgi:DNA polymerase I-like protein with 3'-5' exonuclease and polymerase domains